MNQCCYIKRDGKQCTKLATHSIVRRDVERFYCGNKEKGHFKLKICKINSIKTSYFFWSKRYNYDQEHPPCQFYSHLNDLDRLLLWNYGQDYD